MYVVCCGGGSSRKCRSFSESRIQDRGVDLNRRTRSALLVNHCLGRGAEPSVSDKEALGDWGLLTGAMGAGKHPIP